jgi:hypothetical protein
MDWSYKPLQRLELGFTVAFGDSRNFDTTTAGLNTEAVRMIVSLVERGQIRTDFSREEVVPSDPRATYPFEMTGGRAPGRSWLWDGALDYRLTNFLQASASYNGRSEAGASVVHTARAEVRAFF